MPQSQHFKPTKKTSIDQNLPIYKHEYTEPEFYYVSELLRQCGWQLEELKLSDTRVECSVRKQNGNFQKYIILRSPHYPNQFSSKCNAENINDLPEENSANQQEFPPEKRSSNLPSGDNYKPISKNSQENEKESSNIQGLYFMNNCNDIQRREFYLAPQPRNQHSLLKSNDLSLYEETKQCKSGNVTTIERFQRYKIRPRVDSLLKVAHNGQQTMSDVSDKFDSSPEILTDSKKIGGNHGNLVVNTKSEPNNSIIFLSKSLSVSPFGKILSNDALFGHPENYYRGKNLSLIDSVQNTSLSRRQNKTEPKQSSNILRLETEIPHIKFTKPQELPYNRKEGDFKELKKGNEIYSCRSFKWQALKPSINYETHSSNNVEYYKPMEIPGSNISYTTNLRNKIEPNNYKTDIVSHLPLKVTEKDVTKSGPLLKTKIEHMTRLKNQIGKTSLKSKKILLAPEYLLQPYELSMSIQNSSARTSGELGHTQRVSHCKEGFIQTENQITLHKDENTKRGQSVISTNWNCITKNDLEIHLVNEGHNYVTKQKENVLKAEESKGVDTDQCSIM